MTIIHGTLRPQDLIPAFLNELSIRDPETYEQITFAFFPLPPAHAIKDDDAEWWYSEEASISLATLQDALDAASPDGCYFGTHPGDGSDFGYWPIDDTV